MPIKMQYPDKEGNDCDHYDGTSPFFWLSKTRLGLIWLTNLFQYRDDILAALTITDLSCSPEKASYAGCSVFFLLTMHTLGQHILLSLLIKNTSILEAVRLDMLCQMPAIGEYAGRSAWLMLAADKETGHPILLQLLEHNHALRTQFHREKQHLLKRTQPPKKIIVFFSEQRHSDRRRQVLQKKRETAKRRKNNGSGSRKQSQSVRDCLYQTDVGKKVLLFTEMPILSQDKPVSQDISESGSNVLSAN